MTLTEEYLKLKQAAKLLADVMEATECGQDECEECSLCDVEKAWDILCDLILGHEQAIIRIHGEKKLKELAAC